MKTPSATTSASNAMLGGLLFHDDSTFKMKVCGIAAMCLQHATLYQPVASVMPQEPCCCSVVFNKVSTCSPEYADENPHD